MIINNVVGMEVTNQSLRGLKLLPVGLLLLEHLLLILSSLVLKLLLSLLYHIINVFWSFVDCPSVVNFSRLESILVLIHKNINLSVFLDLNFDLLNFIND